MSHRRRDTLVAATALVAVVALTISPAGADIRRALSSRNSATVNGVKASFSPRANSLVALDPSARLPRRTLLPGTAARGVRGAQGPAGAPGPRGTAGVHGPGETRVYRNAKVFGPFTEDFNFNALTATNVAPGTWLALATAKLRRPSGGEYLVTCDLTNGLTTFDSTMQAIGAEPGGSGMTDASTFATGVFQSELPVDIAVNCDSTLFGPAAGGAEVYDALLVLARLPAASARIAGS